MWCAQISTFRMACAPTWPSEAPCSPVQGGSEPKRSGEGSNGCGACALSSPGQPKPRTSLRRATPICPLSATRSRFPAHATKIDCARCICVVRALALALAHRPIRAQRLIFSQRMRTGPMATSWPRPCAPEWLDLRRVEGAQGRTRPCDTIAAVFTDQTFP